MSQQYGGLEQAVQYSVRTPYTAFSEPMYVTQVSTPTRIYQDEPVNYQQATTFYSLFKSEVNYQFIPDNFLRSGLDKNFVGKAEEIKIFVEEAFEKLFEEQLPKDIKISLLDEEEFRKIAKHKNAVGLSINRMKFGLISEIIVLKDTLGKVLLTVGHELGHVLTPTLVNAHEEEAKAYAFSLEWMKIIKENNIGDLREAIILENPANNGLHNVAFVFVQKLLKEGKKAWSIYKELSKGMISFQADF